MYSLAVCCQLQQRCCCEASGPCEGARPCLVNADQRPAMLLLVPRRVTGSGCCQSHQVQVCAGLLDLPLCLHELTAAWVNAGKQYPVTINEMLLRGCTLKNSKSIIGAVVYTGNESRIQKNSAKTPHKIGASRT